MSSGEQCIMTVNTPTSTVKTLLKTPQTWRHVNELALYISYMQELIECVELIGDCEETLGWHTDK